MSARSRLRKESDLAPCRPWEVSEGRRARDLGERLFENVNQARNQMNEQKP